MMQSNPSVYVSAIEKLDKGKYRISFDTSVVCLVYGYEIRGLHLDEGVAISEDVYRHILYEIVGKRAKKRVLHLLERMDRTESQLRTKLMSSEYPVECVEDAIEYVKSFHYLDDARYAENFIRYSKERHSRQQLKQKLMAKGVSGTLIDEALEREYDTDESEQIRRILQKKHFDPEDCEQNEFRRVYQYLLRRGFHSSDILREMKQY